MLGGGGVVYLHEAVMRFTHGPLQIPHLRAESLGFRVQGLGFRVQGLGFRVPTEVRGQAGGNKGISLKSFGSVIIGIHSPTPSEAPES